MVPSPRNCEQIASENTMTLAVPMAGEAFGVHQLKGRLEKRLMVCLVSNQAIILQFCSKSVPLLSPNHYAFSQEAENLNVGSLKWHVWTVSRWPPVSSKFNRKNAPETLSAVRPCSVQPGEGWLFPGKETGSSALCIFICLSHRGTPASPRCSYTFPYSTITSRCES